MNTAATNNKIIIVIRGRRFHKQTINFSFLSSGRRSLCAFQGIKRRPLRLLDAYA
jgi:hypothetical protein